MHKKYIKHYVVGAAAIVLISVFLYSLIRGYYENKIDVAVSNLKSGNMNEAFLDFKALSDDGNEVAISHLINMYALGVGTTRDETQAIKLIKKLDKAPGEVELDIAYNALSGWGGR